MDNRMRILEAALNLFITKGFDGTPTAKIAQAAAVSNGTLFHYFKTKEALISELYITIKEEYKNYLLENMPQSETLKGRLKQLWICCARWYAENRDKVTFFTMFTSSPHIDNLTKEESSRNFIFIYNLFTEGIEKEIIIDINQELIMHYFYSSIRAFSNFAAESPDRFDKFVEAAFQMWWRSAASI